MSYEKINGNKSKFNRRSICLKVNHYLWETLRYLWDTMPHQWSPCFLVLPMLIVWHYTTQWSSDTAPVLLTGHYAMPVVTWWSTTSATDLRVFLLSGVFYLAVLPAFSRIPWGQQFNLKVSRASCWSSKHSPSPTICLNHSNLQKICMW